eukprot:scaffold3382_cov58-Phaeocystis_antarctica.AAC.11
MDARSVSGCGGPLTTRHTGVSTTTRATPACAIMPGLRVTVCDVCVRRSRGAPSAGTALVVHGCESNNGQMIEGPDLK